MERKQYNQKLIQKEGVHEMQELTEEQKQGVLDNIERIRDSDLISYLKSGQITYEEMKATGRLMRNVQAQIEAYVKAEEEKLLAERKYWEKATVTNTIVAYEDYLMIYPNGIYASNAQDQIEQVRQEKNRRKEACLNDIRNTQNKVTQKAIEDYIGSGIITKDDLVSAGLITAKALEVFLNPPAFLEKAQRWNDLDPLPLGFSDVYFFGIPSSGKSCVLAGLFYHANRSREITLQQEISNEVGMKYKNELMKCVNLGIVPPSTSKEPDTVNYISFTLKDKGHKRNHKFSILEMSGEYFLNTYERNSIDEKSSIGARGYLSNNNRKIIFLVVDYHKDGFDGYDFNEIADQEQLLTYCLDKLESNETFKKTDSIQIIVTKCDLMPNNVDRSAYCKQFLQEKYGNLIDRITDVYKKYDIHSRINYELIYHPFSLGRFMLGKTFEFDPSSSDKLLKSMLNNSSSTKDGNGLLNFFT